VDRPHSVLFACTLNAVRSPMAAGILSHLMGPNVRISSAGVRAGLPDPFAMAVMNELGIDVSEHEPRSFRDLGDETFDLIVTLSPDAHHHALELTRAMAVKVEYWPTLDVTATAGGLPRKEVVKRYRQVRDELFERIKVRFRLDGGPVV
jgi:protein-tyrosine-phosphatase